jgi:hypothetical protein
MDTPIVIILILFAAAVVYLALRNRGELIEEVKDLLDGEEAPKSAAPPPKEDKPLEQPSFGEVGGQPSPAPLPADERLREQEETPPPPTSQPPPAPSIQPPPRPITPPAPIPQTEPEPEPAAPWDVETGGDEPVSRQPTRGEGSPAPIPVPGGSAIVADQVKFSAYYPRETAPQVWNPLVGYAFRQSAASDVIKDVGAVLGTRTSEFRRTEDTARITVQEGAMLTAIPTLPGCQINPPQITLGFYEPFHRFDFKVRATSAPLDQAVNGLLTFTVEGVIVAELPLSLFVGRSVGESMTGAVTKPAYNSIFCSYSHDDTQIVERVEKAYKALGLTYLRDVESLRSGQNWNEELLRLIEQADIFQLFWSQAASESKYVRQEWEHALKSSRAIRPVYWQKPIPRVPDELRSLHFAYTPELDD